MCSKCICDECRCDILSFFLHRSLFSQYFYWHAFLLSLCRSICYFRSHFKSSNARLPRRFSSYQSDVLFKSLYFITGHERRSIDMTIIIPSKYKQICHRVPRLTCAHTNAYTSIPLQMHTLFYIMLSQTH